jgi:LuxR family maltose regulon positive regulatory protein
MVTELAVRRRIIRRPRLTSMLDESSARIRLLIAPAGYGKTTLARQWLGEPGRNDAWYRGGPASADVAALAAGLSEAVGAIIPDAGKRMGERLRATGHPEEDVEVLADLLAEDVQTWPADAWLAFDDYQFAMESVASEHFVDLLTQSTPIQMLLTSRARPSWATARRIIYGEIQEIERQSLAMRPVEVQKILGRDDPELARFLERARGWPAVIGLIGLSPSTHTLTSAVPEQLYQYFAQELYETLPRAHCVALGKISFASRFDRSFAEQVLGGIAKTVIESGLQSGILSASDQYFFEFHPLFAEFLCDRVFETFAEKQQAAEKVGQILLTAGRWDEAVDVACRFELPRLLIATIDTSLYSLLDSGRLVTLTRWLEAGAMLQLNSPTLDLAEAEVAFRVGDYRRAEGKAEQAATRLGTKSSLTTRAHFRAGHSALLASREEASIAHFQRAREAAQDARDFREALFGLYSAMSELEWPEATDVLVELDRLELDTPDDQLRASAAKLTNALRVGGLEETLTSASSASVALEKAANPMIITSFLHAFSNASSAAGRYEEGLRSAHLLLSSAKEHRLGFVQPFGVIDRAIGYLGLRRFAEANHDMELVASLVPDDIHIQGNAAALRCRLLLATGRGSLAAKATEFGFLDEKPPAPLQSELLALRALALACAGDARQPLTVLYQAEKVSKNAPVVRVLAPAVRSICSTSLSEREEHAYAAWLAADSTGNLDTIVCAYRAYPDLLRGFATGADLNRLGSILMRANDLELAERCGIPILRRHTSSRGHLTARETEVMDLVATGLSNREVAQALFITESTVKAHLRHAYEKLGVRGRSEAVPKWLTRTLP